MIIELDEDETIIIKGELDAIKVFMKVDGTLDCSRTER